MHPRKRFPPVSPHLPGIANKTTSKQRRSTSRKPSTRKQTELSSSDSSSTRKSSCQSLVGAYCVLSVILVKLYHWTSMGGTTLPPPFYVANASDMNCQSELAVSISIKTPTQESIQLHLPYGTQLMSQDGTTVLPEIKHQMSNICKVSLEQTGTAATSSCVHRVVRSLKQQRSDSCRRQEFFIQPKPHILLQVMFRVRRNIARLLAGPYAVDVMCDVTLRSRPDNDNDNDNEEDQRLETVTVASFYTQREGFWGPSSLCPVEASHIIMWQSSNSIVPVKQEVNDKVIENVHIRGGMIHEHTGLVMVTVIAAILYGQTCQHLHGSNVVHTTAGADSVAKHHRTTTAALAKDPVHIVLALIISLSHSHYNFGDGGRSPLPPSSNVFNGTLSLHVLYCMSGYFSAKTIHTKVRRMNQVVTRQGEHQEERTTPLSFAQRARVARKFLLRRAYVLATISTAFIVTMAFLEYTISIAEEWEAREESSEGQYLHDPSSIKTMWSSPTSTVVDSRGTIVADTGNIFDALFFNIVFPLQEYQDWDPGSTWWSPARAYVYCGAWSVPLLIVAYSVFACLFSFGGIFANVGDQSRISGWHVLLLFYVASMIFVFDVFMLQLFLYGACLFEYETKYRRGTGSWFQHQTTLLVCTVLLPPVLLRVCEIKGRRRHIIPSLSSILAGAFAIALMHAPLLQRFDRWAWRPRWSRSIVVGLTFGCELFVRNMWMSSVPVTPSYDNVLCRNGGAEWCMTQFHLEAIIRHVVCPICLGFGVEWAFGIASI